MPGDVPIISDGICHGRIDIIHEPFTSKTKIEGSTCIKVCIEGNLGKIGVQMLYFFQERRNSSHYI